MRTICLFFWTLWSLHAACLLGSVGISLTDCWAITEHEACFPQVISSSVSSVGLPEMRLWPDLAHQSEWKASHRQQLLALGRVLPE